MQLQGRERPSQPAESCGEWLSRVGSVCRPGESPAFRLAREFKLEAEAARVVDIAEVIRLKGIQSALAHGQAQEAP